MNYIALIPTRNGALTIERTLDSILDQELAPACICVVNDGSSDNTAEILRGLARRSPTRLIVLTMPDHGYDIRRVPANLNQAYDALCKVLPRYRYLMISGDDCEYPTHYTSLIMSRMEQNSSLAIASGRPVPEHRIAKEHSPSGSGRIVRLSFWQEIGSRYPVRAGWETWLLYRALAKGLTVEIYDDILYRHLRQRGSSHQFTYWGAAMNALGYHPLYALGRVAKNLMNREVAVKGPLSMLRGYMQALIGWSDPFMSDFEEPLRRFVRERQKGEIISIARKLMLGRSWSSLSH